MSSKKIFGKIHLWLGLVSAPLVFFVCITGTIIVFSDEIMELSAGNARFVGEVKDQKYHTEELINIIKQELPQFGKPSYLVSYRDPNRSIRFNCYSKEKGLRMVYMDQYTGEILKVDATIYFFYIMAHLHQSLLLHEPGAWIVDITTLIFLIILITGLILWWPKKWSKNQRKASFSIKYNASKKRLNYDLHKVLGFYALSISLLLIFTGLLIGFKPLAAFTKNSFGGDADLHIKQVFAKVSTDSTTTVVPINQVIDSAFTSYPKKTEAQLYTYYLNDWDFYALNIANKIGIKSAMNAELVAYYKNTGKRYNIPSEFIINRKVENAYWTLHMGNYMGMFGKVFTFIGGLIGSMLSITGFIIWNGKRKKKSAFKNEIQS